MSDTIQFKRKSAIHWDSVSFDGLFLTLRELQRAIALKKFPDSLERAEEAIEVLEGDVKLTDPLKQIPRGSKVSIRFVRVEERRSEFQQRPAGPPAAAPGQGASAVQAAAAGADLFAGGGDDLAAIAAHLDQQDAGQQAVPGRGSRGGFRRGAFGGRGRGRFPLRCQKCGEEHDRADCPHTDAQKKTLVSGIPQSNLVPDKDGTLLLPGGVFARALPDPEAFQQIVGGRQAAQPAALQQGPSGSSQPAFLEPPSADQPLALTQFPHGDAPRPAQPSVPSNLPQLAGEDMVFTDAFLEEPLPAPGPRSPLPPRSPQPEAVEAQLARVASLDLRTKESELQQLQRKQAAMSEPLTMDEFRTLQRLTFEVEQGRELREQRHQQRERDARSAREAARAQATPPRPQQQRARAHSRSRSPTRSRSRRRRSSSRDRSRRHAHRSRYTSLPLLILSPAPANCSPLSHDQASLI